MSEPIQWSYSGSPSTSDKDAVRFLVGDVNGKDKQLDDREILWMLSDLGSPLEAAIAAAQSLQARYSREVDTTAGKVTEGRSKMAESYKALVETLISRRARQAVGAFAGGISKSDKTTRELDDDRVDPAFKRHLQETRVSRFDPIRDTNKDEFG